MLMNEITGRRLMKAPAAAPMPGEPSEAATILLKIANQIDPDESHWRLPPAGIEGAVAIRGKVAYKVFDARSAYTDFIRMVRQHQDNPHWPRITSYKPSFHGGPWSVVRMEALEPVEDRQLGRQYLAEICFLIWTANRRNVRMHTATVSTASTYVTELPLVWRRILGFPVGVRQQTIEDAATSAPASWRQAVGQLLGFARTTGHSYLDLHSGNFMRRADGTLVITDPFVRFTSQRK
jgi:hypothetical protein